MLIDRPEITETSFLVNATIASGASNPANPDIGELFFRTDLGVMTVYNGVSWVDVGAASIGSHASDGTLHLSAAQNTLLDGLTLPSLTPADVNALIGLQTYLSGQSATSLQNRLTAIDSLNTTQSNNITSLQSTSGTTTTTLNNHIGDNTVHLTTAQNALLDGLAGTLTSTELNYVDGVTSSIQSQLDTLAGASASAKLSISGAAQTVSSAVTFTSAVTATAGITGLPLVPAGATSAVSKDYVDNLVSGLSWKQAARVATTANITLSGTQTIDGVAVVAGNRVLVKDQTTTSQNGIYLVSTSAWSRAVEADTAAELDGASVFVTDGTVNADTAWVQTATIATLGTDPVVWGQFAAAGGASAGNGIQITGSTISVKNGLGLTFSGTNLVVDKTVRLSFNGNQLDLQDIYAGATAVVGSASAIPQLAIDQFGRVTSRSTFTLNSDNVTEGSTNVFFTQTRARTSISVAGTGLSYASGTGIITSNASNLNGSGTIVARDGAGNFSAGTITANLTGNATSASSAATLTTPRTINGVSFDGSANITVNTVQGVTFNSAGAGVVSGTFNGSSPLTVSYNTVGAPSTTGTGASGTWGINISGNAATATSATNATNVSIADDATNAFKYVTFVDNTGTQPLKITVGGSTPGMAWNPGTGDFRLFGSLGSLTLRGSTTGTPAFITSGNTAGVRIIGSATNLFEISQSGTLSYPDGTLTTPSYRWANDGTTGIYRHSAGTTGIKGALIVENDITAFSDARLKKDVTTISDALGKVSQMRGVMYTRIKDDVRSTGVIAQEIQAVMPEVVKESDTGLSVAYGNLVGVLIEAIKELRQEVQELKAELRAKQ